jgi:hypothetical protein
VERLEAKTSRGPRHRAIAPRGQNAVGPPASRARIP